MGYFPQYIVHKIPFTVLIRDESVLSLSSLLLRLVVSGQMVASEVEELNRGMKVRPTIRAKMCGTLPFMPMQYLLPPTPLPYAMLDDSSAFPC